MKSYSQKHSWYFNRSYWRNSNPQINSIIVTKTNISYIHNCYGCGVCTASCGKKIIHIRSNKDGFYEPYIDQEDECTECGICLDVCAFNHKELSLAQEEINIKAWAAWSNNENVRLKCSSGGIGFEIGKQLIEQGYKAVGCRYDINEQRAEHYIATTVGEFVQSIGSKYIQSYTEKAFKQIQKRKQKYLISGTPCQIDSFRRMIRRFNCEDNFILMDFYCHCVPSMHAWKAYIKMLEPQIGRVTYASWRNKQTGWHDSWSMDLIGDKGRSISWMSKGDMFYKLFLGDMTLGPQCQKQCKYKYDKSSADIRIGDLWGQTYLKDQKGVSSLVTFTTKGLDIVEELTNVTLIEHSFEIVAEGQMKNNAYQKELSQIVRYLLRKEVSLTNPLFKTVFFIQRIISKLKTVIR